MITDNQLDNLLRDYNPDTGKGRDLIAELERRMDAVDMVMEYQARQIAMLHRRAIIALVAGVVIGIIIMIVSQLFPTPAETLAITTRFSIINALLNNCHYILGSLCIMLVVYGGYEMSRTRELIHQKQS